MLEYYFLKKKGHNPFAMLFSEPREVYDEWVQIFKGEAPVKTLLEKAVSPGYDSLLLDSIKRNDPIKVWDTLYKFAAASPRSTIVA